ncbi:MAG: hypothetical protein ACXACG_11185 [Candidatus Thorarchaeota archaeon]|jgi:hypothetical protein
MIRTIEGKIISTNLGEFSKKRIIYGYLGIELPDKKHIQVKVDSYTWYETLAIGDEVVVEVETLLNTDIIVARKIQLKSSTEPSSDEVTATA